MHFQEIVEPGPCKSLLSSQFDTQTIESNGQKPLFGQDAGRHVQGLEGDVLAVFTLARHSLGPGVHFPAVMPWAVPAKAHGLPGWPDSIHDGACVVLSGSVESEQKKPPPHGELRPFDLSLHDAIPSDLGVAFEELGSRKTVPHNSPTAQSWRSGFLYELAG
ncbi:hypothetical protein MKZ38_004966 [Zalerion maritima]|uniref:Uncharacterized protein n=1 Tax=Zalerion maritima TaxID=339359 RepID=A0AAD5RLB6_9PEZI|nr:hypothetical protein MKZ38_004966 [Zalerion maritima]